LLATTDMALCRYLVQKADELEARIETALLLLEQRGVLSDAEYATTGSRGASSNRSIFVRKLGDPHNPIACQFD
jgi:hypothetical protein